MSFYYDKMEDKYIDDLLERVNRRDCELISIITSIKYGNIQWYIAIVKIERRLEN